jgi:hypothetical protein
VPTTRGVAVLPAEAGLQPPAEPSVDVDTIPTIQGVLMERELTPTEARSGVISGRVILILIVSSTAAAAALAIAWFVFSRV